MRLAQLARRISVKPSEISEFLASKNIEIENSSNAKVNDDHVDLVIEHFAPELLKVEDELEVSAEAEPKEIKPEGELEAPEIEHLISSSQAVQESSESEEILPEVIKPLKVELPGLKVVGKIDLPEPKKKEEEQESIDEGDTEGETLKADEPPRKPRRDNKRMSRPRHDQDRRPRKNPIALKREREEQEALRKKLEAKEREKELRTQRYLKKVSSKVTPPKPIHRATHADEYEVLEQEEPKPKSFFGKIINWFVSD